MPEGEKERTREDRIARSVAVERTYVHEVYDEIAPDLARSKDPLKATVHKFLKELEPGSLVADIGCGDGRYLSVNSRVHTIGTDRSGVQAQITKSRQNECLVGDNLGLPFRSEVFDAVTSISVVHHLATSGRRVKALRELARILRVGGKILITVHALDQESKIFSRDVLLAWYQSPRCKPTAGNHRIDPGQHEEDIKEDCNDYDDSISLPSSDEEEEEVFPLQRIRPVRMISDISQQESVFKKKPEQRTWRSLDTSPRYDNPTETTRNSLENPLPGYSCYSFVRKALRRLHSSDSSSRLSLQVGRSSKQRSYSADSALPTSPDVSFKDNIAYDHQYYYADGDANHIELRNLDEDDEYPVTLSQESSRSQCPTKDNTSILMSDSKSKLVRSFSDFFKKIPKLWNNKTSSSSCNDLSTSILRDISLQFSNVYASNPQYNNNIVRSQSTATCTFTFDTLSHLERVEELDYFVDLDTVLESLDENRRNIDRCVPRGTQETCDERLGSLTLLDIENGNLLPFPEGKGRNSGETEKCHPDQIASKLIEQTRENELSEQVPNYDFSHYSFFPCKGTHNNHLNDVSSHYSPVDNPDGTFCGLSSEDDGHIKAVKRAIAEENEIDDVMSKLKHMKVNEWTRSPKRHHDQQSWHMVNSRTTGPFYDTDDDEDQDDEMILSSYYSMPELHKLSDFHDEYYVQKQETPKNLVDCKVYTNYYNFVPQQNENMFRCEVVEGIPDNEISFYTNPSSSGVLDNVIVSSCNSLEDTLFERSTFLSETEHHSEPLTEFKDFITQMNRENIGGRFEPKSETADFFHPQNSEELFQPYEGIGHEQKLKAPSFGVCFSEMMKKDKFNEESKVVVVAFRDHHEIADESTIICSSRCQCPPEGVDNIKPSDDETQNHVNTERNICKIPSLYSTSTHDDRKQVNTSDSSLVRLDCRECVRLTPDSCEPNSPAPDGDLECPRSAFSSPIQRNQYSVSDELFGNGQKSGSGKFVSKDQRETTPNAHNERTNSKRELTKDLSQESPKNDDCLNTDNRLEEKEAYSCTSSFRTDKSITCDSGNPQSAHFSTDLSQPEQKTSHGTEPSQISRSNNPSSVQVTPKRTISSNDSPTECSSRKLKLSDKSDHHHHQEFLDFNAFADKTKEAVECSSEKNFEAELSILEYGEPKKVSKSEKDLISDVKIEVQEKVSVCAARCLLNQHGGGKYPLNGNFEMYDEIIPSFDVTASECLSDGCDKLICESMIKSNEYDYRKNSRSVKNKTSEHKNLDNSCTIDGICAKSKCVFHQTLVSCSDVDNRNSEKLSDSNENGNLKTHTSSHLETMSKSNDSCGELHETSKNICSKQDDTPLAISVSRSLHNISDLSSKEVSESDLKTQSNSSSEKSTKERSPIVDVGSNNRRDIKTQNDKAYRNENVRSTGEINTTVEKEITSLNVPEIKFPVVHESPKSQTFHSSAESSHRGKECNITTCQSPNFKSQSVSSKTELLSCRESSLILPTETEDIVDHLYGQVGDEHSSLTTHRYYHLFREGELQELIENYIQELHVLSISFQGSSWCIVAEKVRVWTI